MLKSILDATGLPQNFTRFKTELQDQVDAQIGAVKSAGQHTARAGIWGAVAGVMALAALIIGLFLIYALLEPRTGRAGALAIMFAVLAIGTLVGALAAKKSMADIPPRPQLKFPQFFKDAPPSESGENALPTPMHKNETLLSPRGTSTNDPLFNWLFSVVRNKVPTPATGDVHIDEFISVVKPKAERAVSEAMVKVVDRLRNGDRKTIFAILGTAVFAGVLASRGKRGKHST